MTSVADVPAGSEPSRAASLSAMVEITFATSVSAVFTAVPTGASEGIVNSVLSNGCSTASSVPSVAVLGGSQALGACGGEASVGLGAARNVSAAITGAIGSGGVAGVLPIKCLSFASGMSGLNRGQCQHLRGKDC